MQNVMIRQTGQRWNFLEPAMNPDQARTKHGAITHSSSGTFVLYPAGQVIRQKDDGTNEWAKYGTSGFGGPCMILKYPILVNDQGSWQTTEFQTPIPNEEFCDGSIEAYYQGFFKCQDITSAGGTNEVQYETFDSGVDGGTRTLTLFGHTTAPIAWNATGATVKAALLLAIPELASADITVTDISSFVMHYTFAGVYAGRNMPLIVVNPALLTDGGVAPATTGSVFSEHTAGSGLLTGVGRLVQGTATVGIFELGAAIPV